MSAHISLGKRKKSLGPDQENGKVVGPRVFLSAKSSRINRAEIDNQETKTLLICKLPTIVWWLDPTEFPPHLQIHGSLVHGSFTIVAKTSSFVDVNGHPVNVPISSLVDGRPSLKRLNQPKALNHLKNHLQMSIWSFHTFPLHFYLVSSKTWCWLLFI